MIWSSLTDFDANNPSDPKDQFQLLEQEGVLNLIPEPFSIIDPVNQSLLTLQTLDRRLKEFIPGEFSS
jgi:hypothetical protein|tara:strand:+ start:241 stop:444 length:204 start_codon:yes stop_codon:yes gene_type:complete